MTASKNISTGYSHWVYDCHNPDHTVRIRRHVPFFSTSRDASRYERLKAGLALYRLVFGQVDQEDLLDHLHQQTEGLDLAAKEARVKRLTSYMLNLSPIGHDEAIQHARAEAATLLSAASDYTDLRRLLMVCKQLVIDRAHDLSEVKAEIEGLLLRVEQAIEAGNTRSKALREAVAALAYLRNPYDHIFDLHSEGGFVDDIEVIQRAWLAVSQRPDNRKDSIGPGASIGATQAVQTPV